MTDPLDKFGAFCANLRIESKEKGVIPLRFNGCQRHLIEEVRKGLAEGIRTFLALKARQEGISTVMLALDLYWMFRFPGTQGSLTVDTDGNKNYFRSILNGYMGSLPSTWKHPVQTFNRDLLSFEHPRGNSRLVFQTAGTRSSGGGGLSRGKGLNYLHGTEISSWGNEEGLASLVASLAETYENRFYMFESTARGFNMFYEMCEGAKDAVGRRFIFIPWWKMEAYACAAGTKQFEAYAGDPTGEELEWIDAIRAQYGHVITTEQLVWWRWKLYEEVIDEMLMHQDFPGTPELAFVMSGSAFFDSHKLTQAFTKSQKQAVEQYSYGFGEQFYDTTCNPDAEGELAVWEKPVPGATYVVGADPAGGASETSDNFAVQVFRCYADGMDQVAEFQARGVRAYQFAWVLAHITGAYRGRLNLELNGPGTAVWQELQRMIPEAAYFDKNMNDADREKYGDIRLMDVMRSINHYLYTRPDSVGMSANFYHTVTNERIKQTFMHGFRDGFERGQIQVRSPRLLKEMQRIRQESAGGRIAAQGHGHDDLTIAAGLATLTWVQDERTTLIARGLTRERQLVASANATPPAERIVGGFVRQALRDHNLVIQQRPMRRRH